MQSQQLFSGGGYYHYHVWIFKHPISSRPCRFWKRGALEDEIITGKAYYKFLGSNDPDDYIMAAVDMLRRGTVLFEVKDSHKFSLASAVSPHQPSP